MDVLHDILKQHQPQNNSNDSEIKSPLENQTRVAVAGAPSTVKMVSFLFIY